MNRKYFTLSFRLKAEDCQDYIANLHEMGIYNYSEDLRNYVIGFNHSVGVDVQIKRNNVNIERLQKENKQLILIKKKRLDAKTNQAFNEIKAYIKQYDIAEGEINPPSSDQVLKDLIKIGNRCSVGTNSIGMNTMLDMFENIAPGALKDDEICQEFMLSIENIREKYGIKKENNGSVQELAEL